MQRIRESEKPVQDGTGGGRREVVDQRDFRKLDCPVVERGGVRAGAGGKRGREEVGYGSIQEKGT